VEVPVLRRHQAAPRGCGNTAAGQPAARQPAPQRALLVAPVVFAPVLVFVVAASVVGAAAVVHPALHPTVEFSLGTVAVAERWFRGQHHTVGDAVEFAPIVEAGGAAAALVEQPRGVREFGSVAARLRGSRSGGLGGGHGRA
jgi:hypothetical protein